MQVRRYSENALLASPIPSSLIVAAYSYCIGTSAVTLACTAAFAAGSVALLCMFIVSGGQTSNGRYLSLQPPPDWPQNTLHHDNRGAFDQIKITDVVKVYEGTGGYHRYGRRALRPNFRTGHCDTDRVDQAWPTGAVWLMVSR